MKRKSLLFPYWCQKAGWWVLAAACVCILALLIISLTDEEKVAELSDWMLYPLEVMVFLPSVALFLICMSKEKEEDEYIGYIRSRSVFIVVLIAFIAGIINFPTLFLGQRMWTLDQVGKYAICTSWMKDPVILTLLYLVIFKGTLFVNRLKTRNDD